MHVIEELVHILNSQPRYSSAQWQHFLNILTPKEVDVVETVRSFQPIPATFSSRQRHKLIAKLCREVSYYTPPPSRCSEYQEKLLHCESYLYTFNVLRILKRHTSAVTLSLKVLTMCDTLDLTLPRIEVFSYLVRYYLPSKGKEYQKYSIALQRYQHIYSAESKAESCYNALEHLPQDSKANKERLAKKATEYQYLLQSYIDKELVSKDFYLSYNRIIILSHIMAGDYEEAIAAARTALQYYRSNPISYTRAITLISTQLVNIYLQIGEVNMALAILSQLQSKDLDCIENIDIHRLKIRILLIQNNYQESYRAYNKLLNSALYKTHTPLDTHKETILKQYFNALILMGGLKTDYVPSRLEINRFHKKEKGINYLKKEIRIQLIIVQLLFNIYYKEYDDIEIQLDTLRDYCARRLSSKSPFLRSNIFIRMLLVIPRCRFNAKRSRRHGKKLYNRLLQSSPEMRKDDRSIEIIPYEHLWEFVLSHLATNYRHKNRFTSTHTLS